MPRPMVTRDPEVLGGAPVIAGTRIYATTIARWLEDGHALDDVFAQYPVIDALPIAVVDALTTFPVPPLFPTQLVYGVSLDSNTGDVWVNDSNWRPDDVPVLCVALEQAADASRQWQRDVDAWIAAHMIEDDDGE